MSPTWKQERVLITGANGFVGGSLAAALLERGAFVVALVRDGNPLGGIHLLDIENRVVVVRGDIRDEGLIRRVLSEYEITVCMHLAAQAVVPVANRDPVSTFETNIRGTWVLLEQCRLAPGRPGVVVASSDKAYGEHGPAAPTEETSLLGAFPYDVSKACADSIARLYKRLYGLPVAVVRMANIYGPADINFSRIIPYTIMCALQDRRIILRGNGSAEREFLHIDDAVEAYLAVASNLHEKGISGEAFNFGSGKAVRILDLVKKILHLAGRDDLEVIRTEGAPTGEIQTQCMDHGKAARILGWHPSVDLALGLRRTLDWYRRNISIGKISLPGMES